MVVESRGLMYPARVNWDAVMAQSAKARGSQIMGLVIALLIGGILTAQLLPIALDQLNSVDTSSWTSGQAALFGILGILFIVVVVAAFAGWAMDAM